VALNVVRSFSWPFLRYQRQVGWGKGGLHGAGTVFSSRRSGPYTTIQYVTADRNGLRAKSSAKLADGRLKSEFKTPDVRHDHVVAICRFVWATTIFHSATHCGTMATRRFPRLGSTNAPWKGDAPPLGRHNLKNGAKVRFG
jgi:hypothetical protein